MPSCYRKGRQFQTGKIVDQVCGRRRSALERKKFLASAASTRKFRFERKGGSLRWLCDYRWLAHSAHFENPNLSFSRCARDSTQARDLILACGGIYFISP